MESGSRGGRVTDGLTGLTELTRLMGLPQPTPLELPGLPAAAETAGLTCCYHCRSFLLWKADSVRDGAMVYLLPPRWRVPMSTTHGNQQESDTVLYFVIYESAHASDLFSRTLVT